MSQPWILAGGTIWIADAHRDDGQRFIVCADELLTAFVERELAIITASELAAARLVRRWGGCSHALRNEILSRRNSIA